MPRTIEIDDDLFELLKENAEPLEDTPSTVLRRLIGVDANGSSSSSAADPTPRRKSSARRRRSTAASGKRADRGTLLPEAEYEIPILQYLDEHGGRAPSREVVDAVGKALADSLTPADKETLRSGDVRWKSRAAFVRLRLVERGDLDGDSPRGTWAITDQGRARLSSK